MIQPTKQLYTAAEVRAMDRHLIEKRGIPGYTLMCRAGQEAFAVIKELWPAARNMLVVCGGGNNGGDGYVVARLAISAGLQVQVAAIVDPARLSGDAWQAYEDCAAAGVTVGTFDPIMLTQADIVVDAIFGIGLDRPLEPETAAVIEAINASRKPVLALDIPSGINADSGEVMGAAVRAAATVCFIGLKIGCFTGAGPEYAGEVHFVDISA